MMVGKLEDEFPFWDQAYIFRGKLAVKFLGSVAVLPLKKWWISSLASPPDSDSGLFPGSKFSRGFCYVLGRVLYTLVKGSLHPGR